MLLAMLACRDFDPGCVAVEGLGGGPVYPNCRIEHTGFQAGTTTTDSLGRLETVFLDYRFGVTWTGVYQWDGACQTELRGEYVGWGDTVTLEQRECDAFGNITFQSWLTTDDGQQTLTSYDWLHILDDAGRPQMSFRIPEGERQADLVGTCTYGDAEAACAYEPVDPAVQRTWAEWTYDRHGYLLTHDIVAEAWSHRTTWERDDLGWPVSEQREDSSSMGNYYESFSYARGRLDETYFVSQSPMDRGSGTTYHGYFGR